MSVTVYKELDLNEQIQSIIWGQEFINRIVELCRINRLEEKIEGLRHRVSDMSTDIKTLPLTMKESVEINIKSRMESELESRLEKLVPPLVVSSLSRNITDFLLNHKEMETIKMDVMNSTRSNTEFLIRDFMHKIVNESEFHLILDSYKVAMENRVNLCIQDSVNRFDITTKDKLEELEKKQSTVISSLLDTNKQLASKYSQLDEQYKKVYYMKKHLDNVTLGFYILSGIVISSCAYFLYNKR